MEFLFSTRFWNKQRKAAVVNHLGLAGRYEVGLIRHLHRSVEALRTPTLASSKLTKIDWLSQEYVACVIGPLASLGTHCSRGKI